MKNSWWMVLLIAAIACGCLRKKNTHADTRLFFYPYQKLSIAQIYVFKDAAHPDEVPMFHLHTMVMQGDTFLVNSEFGYRGDSLVMLNSLTWKINNQHVQAWAFVQIQPGITQTRFDKNPHWVFNWQRDSTYRWKTQLTYANGQETEFIQVRSRLDRDSVIEFEGVKYPCIAIQDEIKRDDKSNNRVRTTEKSTTAWYAKGLGLIYFVVQESGQPDKHFKLEDVMGEEDWEKSTPAFLNH